MKKTILIQVFITIASAILFTSCSSNDDFKQEEHQQSVIVSSFSPDEFTKSLNGVSDFVSTKTRNAAYNEEEAQNVIKPFIIDGKNIQNQLLDDNTLSTEQKDSIENLSDEELAVLSVIAYSAIEAEGDGLTTRTTYPTNKRLYCVSTALVGGGSFSGAALLTVLRKVGTRTFLRMSLSAFGGFVGGAITVAMYLNDYNTCMNS